MIEKKELKHLIDVAAGRVKADLVIRGAKIVDVFSGRIITGDIAIAGSRIAGIGTYDGNEIYDASGLYAAPGFIDSHIHIESSYVTPETLGSLLVPHGTSCIVADPHEIANVCGIAGVEYMQNAAKNTALDIRFMLPSCVPSTPFENAGAILDAKALNDPIHSDSILGLAEFMNAVGVVAGDNEVMDKLLAAKDADKPIDGHSPGLAGNALNAYISAGILTDHECSCLEEMNDRISRGMYVLLRYGSACHDLTKLLPGVTKENVRRCLLCSDDKQVRSILDTGHIDGLLRICVNSGMDAIDAIRMATLNAAECYGLKDQGGIAPGRRADIVLLESLKFFNVKTVWIAGQKCAEDGNYLLPIEKYDTSTVASSVNVKDFSVDRLRLPLKSSRVKTIDIKPGGVLTGKGEMDIQLDEDGCFVFNPRIDVVKIAVVERHHGTGNVAVGLLHGYGIKQGAVALSVAHDSHNIIVTGTSDQDMAAAVEEIIRMKGGMTLVLHGNPLVSIPLPVAGLMSEDDALTVDSAITRAHNIAYETLGVNYSVEPLMTLCFMALPVIPELKITDKGLFDVTKFEFTPVEAD